MAIEKIKDTDFVSIDKVSVISSGQTKYSCKRPIKEGNTSYHCNIACIEDSMDTSNSPTTRTINDTSSKSCLYFNRLSPLAHSFNCNFII